MIVRICIGSSCYLKGSSKITECLQEAVKEHQLEQDVTLVGSFCVGKCSLEGVTVQVDDEIFVGITQENLDAFFKEHILGALGRE